MTAAARARRHRWHAPERGTGPAFLISLGAHSLLFVAIAFVIRWKTEPAGPVSAELWSALPPLVEPAAPPPPPPPVKVERAPEPEPVKPDIVLEPKKTEPKKPEPRPEKKVEPVKKPEPDLKAEQRRREDEARARKAEDAAIAQRQQAALERAMAAAGAASPTGATSASSPGLSDSYRGQIVGCIRPFIAFSVPEGLRPKQHIAEFEVKLLPSGEQVGAPRPLAASGLPAFDQAVERAIRRCDPFPRPREGDMPRSVRLAFDPVEMR